MFQNFLPQNNFRTTGLYARIGVGGSEGRGGLAGELSCLPEQQQPGHRSDHRDQGRRSQDAGERAPARSAPAGNAEGGACLRFTPPESAPPRGSRETEASVRARVRSRRPTTAHSPGPRKFRRLPRRPSRLWVLFLAAPPLAVPVRGGARRGAGAVSARGCFRGNGLGRPQPDPEPCRLAAEPARRVVGLHPQVQEVIM